MRTKIFKTSPSMIHTTEINDQKRPVDRQGCSGASRSRSMGNNTFGIFHLAPIRPQLICALILDKLYDRNFGVASVSCPVMLTQ